MPAWLPPLVAAPFVGSFLGLVVRRLPAGETVVTGRSRCDSCGATLTPFDLVPLASWVWNHARCRLCHARVSPFYPAIELAALAIAVATVFVDASADPVRLWIDCLLGWTLLTLAWIDVEHFLLPDLLTLPLVLAGLAVTAWEAPDAVSEHALAAAVGYLLFRGVAYVYRRWRGREGMGEGDAKLLAAGGAWLGLLSLDWLIVLAAGIGLAGAATAWIAGRRIWLGAMVPFGAALALALFILRLVLSPGG